MHCCQVEEFAHINGWEAYPEEDNLTDKPSSKTSSRVSTPIAEVDSKKAETEVAKTETKPEKKDQAEESKPEPMDVDNSEAGMERNSGLEKKIYLCLPFGQATLKVACPGYLCVKKVTI